MPSWAERADRVVGAGMRAFGGDETVNYQPAAASAFDLASGGVFTAEHERVDLGDVELSSTAPVLGVRLADFPPGQPPVQGDLLTRSGVLWKVAEAQPDGVAGARLILRRTV